MLLFLIHDFCVFFSLRFLVIIIESELDTLITIVNILHSKFSFFFICCVWYKKPNFFAPRTYVDLEKMLRGVKNKFSAKTNESFVWRV